MRGGVKIIDWVKNLLFGVWWVIKTQSSTVDSGWKLNLLFGDDNHCQELWWNSSMKGEYYSDLCALIVYSVQVLNPTMTKKERVCVCGWGGRGWGGGG